MRNSRPEAIGQTIGDKYRVECVLGRGAMGVVLAARHLGLDQLVAIKLLSSDAVQADVMARVSAFCARRS